MKIYTKKGDKGKSALYGGERFFKYEAVFEVLGTLDELNAQLAFLSEPKIVKEIQSDLFLLGSYIANKKTTLKDFVAFKKKTQKIESEIDKLEQELPVLANFILPGGSLLAAHAHLARAVCRRFERRLVSFVLEKNLQDRGYSYILEYINRLSDLLFVLARHYNKQHKVADAIWKKKK